MRATRIGLLLGAVAVVALALAPAATAKPGYIRLPGSFSFSLRLPPVDGYRLAATSTGHGGVIVTATKGRTSASYFARGFANRRRLDADLGRFGRIHVRFDQRSQARLELPFDRRCNGRRPWRLRGTASGTIRFRGLDDFVAFEKRRVRATVRRDFETTCRQGGGTFFSFAATSLDRSRPRPHLSGFHPREDRLLAEGRSGAETIVFEASNLYLPGLPELNTGSISAYAAQRVEGVAISEWAFAPLDRHRLQISRKGVRPPTAHVKGSGPFAGKSSFHRLANGEPEWAGTLRVDLPGEGSVPLSGPGFRARICHEKLRGNGSSRCLPQGSGSHSQSLFETRLSWSR